MKMTIKQPAAPVVPQLKRENIFFEKQSFAFKEEVQNSIHEYKVQSVVEVDDVYQPFRGILIFGKFIGLVPFTGLFQKNVDLVMYTIRSFPGIISVLICILLGLSSITSFIYVCRSKAKDAAEYAFLPAGFGFYTLGFFLYVYYLNNSAELIDILQQWSQMQVRNTKMDIGLTRSTNLMAGIIMTSAILENITGQLRNIPSLFPVDESEKNMNALEIYYKREQAPWQQLLPYNPALSIILFFANKFALYAWNYMDITIAIFARAIYFKFKMLFEVGDSDLFGSSVKNSYDIQKWRHLTEDYATLVIALRQISSFLSPLVFTSYAANIYYIVLHVHLGMKPSGSESFLGFLYAKWAFLHLIARLCMVSLVSAKINTWAHKCSELFLKCPAQAYIMEVERTDHFVSTNTIGLTGLGCFWITKPLLLQIVGVVFTFEIVLLQASQTPLK